MTEILRRRPGGEEAFEKLCAGGVDPKWLAETLITLPHYSRMPAGPVFAGKKAREFEALAAKLEKLALRLDRHVGDSPELGMNLAHIELGFTAEEFSHQLHLASGDWQGLHLKHRRAAREGEIRWRAELDSQGLTDLLVGLPARMVLAAKYLRGITQCGWPWRRVNALHFCLLWILERVKAQTGRYHYTEIARVAGAALGGPEIDPDVLKMLVRRAKARPRVWRIRHRSRTVPRKR